MSVYMTLPPDNQGLPASSAPEHVYSVQDGSWHLLMRAAALAWADRLGRSPHIILTLDTIISSYKE